MNAGQVENVMRGAKGGVEAPELAFLALHMSTN